MKILITADLHIHKYRQFDKAGSRLQYAIDQIEWLFETAAERDCRNIFIAGDIFHQFDTINNTVVNRVADGFSTSFKRHPKISSFSISGNHDYGSRIGDQYESSIEFLTNISPRFHNFDYCFLPIDEQKFAFIPYTGDLSLFQEYWHKMGVDKNTVVICHDTIAGISDSNIPAILPLDLLSGAKRVFAGHIHRHQVITPTVCHIGSLQHQDLGDVGQRKSALLYDTDTDSFEHIYSNFPEFRIGVKADEFNYWVDDKLKSVKGREQAPAVIKYDPTVKTPEQLLETYIQDIVAEDDRDFFIQIAKMCL
jgi:DNA repair exonuclease SbcCD nuclease subunit